MLSYSKSLYKRPFAITSIAEYFCFLVTPINGLFNPFRPKLNVIKNTHLCVLDSCRDTKDRKKKKNTQIHILGSL